MSRYTGPRLKVLRALGVDLPGLSRKSMQERNQPPGQHGARKLAARKSGYGLQLMEKQKLRFNYGLTETQLRRVVAAAKKDRGATGDKLVELLERRLDNMVFRAGFAPTIPAARQLVRHRHILVNGKRVNVPSYRLSVGDEVTIRPKSAELVVIKESLERVALTRPEWMRYEEDTRTARVQELPLPSAVPFPIEMQLIVEFYSKRL